eukprot:CAMPEP_0206485976 /NCGR_PEP_ID=MMETSP0324_2-20121206/40797_1 /ASSEMBLY_ACC=CAM_ASM_000836 /TAXON_ID=2866 /ORGANISM="Crypthecodinium cohnii, Strain Seligo" /LENGTH=662 /DNA_ID=CAMNT_0053964231 /DNA_START=10 /DNA_END=1998 /DNA_ORIENTATION=-
MAFGPNAISSVIGKPTADHIPTIDETSTQSGSFPSSSAASSPTRPPKLNRAGSQTSSRDGSEEQQLPIRRASTLEKLGLSTTIARANSLPKNHEDLKHAASMPMLFTEAPRPFWGRLWTCPQLVGFLLAVASLLFFCVGRPIQEFPKSNEMLGVTFFCAFFWVFEVVPICITALVPMVLLPTLKITSSRIVAQAYWNWISVLVVATYLVSLAVEESRLPKRLVLRFLLTFPTMSPAMLLATLMGFCFLLAMFVNRVVAADRRCLESKQLLKDAQRFGDALLLGLAYAASCGGMATLTGAIAHYFLAGMVNVDTEVNWASWLEFAGPIALVCGLAAYIVLYFRYIFKTTVAGLSKELLEAEEEELHTEVGSFSRDEFMVLLIQVLQLALLVLRPYAISPNVTSSSGGVLVNDAAVAAIPALLLFFVPSSVRPRQALLSWPTVHERLDFGLVLLVGGGMAINSGFAQSGLNLIIGNCIGQIIPHLGAYALNLCVIIVVTLACQVFSNVGAAATLLPVMASAALQAVVNPLRLLLPATIATSLVFLLPTATPSNVVALAKSTDLARSLRTRDFFLAGVPLTIAACLVSALLTQVMGETLFNVHSPLPKWACDTAPSANCLFAKIPGYVEGAWVQEQACIIDQSAVSDGLSCRIWNGTTYSTLDLM